MRSGDALGEIVAYMETHDIDHVVIDEHLQTKLRPMLKDIPEAVAGSVSKPVMVIC